MNQPDMTRSRRQDLLSGKPEDQLADQLKLRRTLSNTD
jgi:hypothetical protein